MEHLFDLLWENGESGIYPYHMPGHKRNACGSLPREMYLRDITEIDGFDNLHQPEGILLDLQKEAAALYGAEESFYLVNGSTGGILSAVSAALSQGGHLLMARNCHKSAYHAAYLRTLTISYLYPQVLKEYDIFDAVSREQVQRALEREPDIGAVLIVSPTYEGRISPIREIAELVHAKGIPLIVDEAHGAHLGLCEGSISNSCQAGADLVIHSVHKTLPSLTQTALLHVNGNLIDRERLRRFLHIYQSSSPSYLLMAGIDNALTFMKSEEGKRQFAQFCIRWEKMLGELEGCRHLHFLRDERSRQDIGKLVISVKGTNVSGKWLYETLLNQYRLQMEMAGESYVLAMFTVNDTEEGYRRLTGALLEIDSQLEAVEETAKEAAERTAKEAQEEAAERTAKEAQEGVAERTAKEAQEEAAGRTVKEAQEEVTATRKGAMPLALAWDGEKEERLLEDSIGCYAGEFINLYPPGVPVLVPGEQITGEICESIRKWQKQGLCVQGITQKGEGLWVPVLKK